MMGMKVCWTIVEDICSTSQFLEQACEGYPLWSLRWQAGLSGDALPGDFSATATFYHLNQILAACVPVFRALPVGLISSPRATPPPPHDADLPTHLTPFA